MLLVAGRAIDRFGRRAVLPLCATTLVVAVLALAREPGDAPPAAS